ARPPARAPQSGVRLTSWIRYRSGTLLMSSVRTVTPLSSVNRYIVWRGAGTAGREDGPTGGASGAAGTGGAPGGADGGLGTQTHEEGGATTSPRGSAVPAANNATT